MSVTSAEWLRLIEQEYLSSFITSGGSAVKFAVMPDPGTADLVSEQLDSLAKQHGLVRASLDSAATRLHMIQDVFFGIARQIDWLGLAQSFMELLFAKQAYLWPRVGEPMTIHELADANAVDLTIMQRDVRQWLTAGIMRDNAMAQDFRIAMTQLCLERLAPNGADSAPVAPVLEWLRGELRTIGPLKSTSIYSQVTRHNARPMLRSLGRWLRLLGHKGLLLTLDIRRLAHVVPVGSVGVRYTPAAVLDAYEVLRQLIDEADHFEGFFLAVLADPEFVNGDARRSIDSYTALKMRIWDDVKAKERDNPLAPLVTLTQEGAP